MSKRLIYVAFWQEELQTLLEHLKTTSYTQAEIEHIESLLNDKASS